MWEYLTVYVVLASTTRTLEQDIGGSLGVAMPSISGRVLTFVCHIPMRLTYIHIGEGGRSKAMRQTVLSASFGDR